MAAKKRVLITRALPPDVLARARADYDADINDDGHVMDQAELLRRAEGAEAILSCLSEKFTAEVFEKLPASVKIVSTFSVGTDHIDLDAARAKGVRIGNTPEAVTISTAEVAMLLILAAAHRASEGERMVRGRKWVGWEPTMLLGTRLSGKRLGILGMGQIGKAVARRAQAFDMEIHYHNRNRLSPEEEVGATYHDSLEKLLAVSDVLSLHAPSTPQTRHCIDAKVLGLLPNGAIFVNTARGDLVVEEDLLAALRSGKVAAAGLDVFENEPAIREAFMELDNTFLLPHLGSATVEARNEMGFAALDNIDAVLAGREPPWPVV